MYQKFSENLKSPYDVVLCVNAGDIIIEPTKPLPNEVIEALKEFTSEGKMTFLENHPGCGNYLISPPRHIAFDVAKFLASELTREFSLSTFIREPGFGRLKIR